MNAHRRDIAIIASALCCMVGIAVLAVSKSHGAEHETRKVIIKRVVPETESRPKVIGKGTIYLIEDRNGFYIVNDVFDCEETTIKRVHGEKRQELLDLIQNYDQ